MLKSKFPFYLFFFLFLFPGASAQKTASDSLKSGFNWPDDHRAAVCLTYDDGLDCHLDIAQKALDEFGFKGTFYCQGNSASLRTRMEDWQALVNNGHELGNHSLYHPCIKAKAGRDTFDWVKPEYDLEHYTKAQILGELELANTLLRAVDGKASRTYAYTCGDYLAGGTSFVEDMPRLFTAARQDGPIPSHVEQANIYLMPSMDVAGYTGADLIAYVENARKMGSVATLMFHGVGADHLAVSEEAHRELMVYLDQHREIYWIDTFQRVAEHISREQALIKSDKSGIGIQKN